MKMSRTNGNSAADGLKMPCRLSVENEMHSSASAAPDPIASTCPPRRRASATTPRIETMFTAAVVSVSDAGAPTRAGSASSQ